MVLTILTVVDAAYYGVRTYFRLPDLRMYPLSDVITNGELHRLIRIPLSFSGSIPRIAIQNAVRGSYYRVEYAKAVYHRMECIVWKGLRIRATVVTLGMATASLTSPTHGSYPS